MQTRSKTSHGSQPSASEGAHIPARLHQSARGLRRRIAERRRTDATFFSVKPGRAWLQLHRGDEDQTRACLMASSDKAVHPKVRPQAIGSTGRNIPTFLKRLPWQCLSEPARVVSPGSGRYAWAPSK